MELVVVFFLWKQNIEFSTNMYLQFRKTLVYLPAISIIIKLNSIHLKQCLKFDDLQIFLGYYRTICQCKKKMNSSGEILSVTHKIIQLNCLTIFQILVVYSPKNKNSFCSCICNWSKLSILHRSLALTMVYKLILQKIL